MSYQRIVFTKPQVAELLPYEIEDPAADQVQVALERSTISSGTERANLMGSKTIAWDLPEAKEAILTLTKLGRLHLSDLIEEVCSPKDAPAIFARLCREKSFPIVQFDWSLLK